MKKGINIKRVVAKLATTIIVLYAGGFVLQEVGKVLNKTALPFNSGLSLIGYTISSTTNASGKTNCLTDTGGVTGYSYDNCVTSVDGTGILTVVGIIGIASIILEFVQFRL